MYRFILPGGYATLLERTTVMRVTNKATSCSSIVKQYSALL